MRLEILRDGALPGAENMARDWGLFERVEAGEDVVLLRIYGWEPACLSLGANQEESSVDTDALHELGFDLVRRPTGGGAILHWDELTYGWAAPRSFFPDPSVDAVLAWGSRALQEFYRGLGLEARSAIETPTAEPFGRRTAACYAGRERWDLTVDGRKIGGNAQRRGRRAIFQHGSIPISLDWELVCRLTRTHPSVAQPTCLAEALGGPLDRGLLEERLAEAWRRAFRT